MLNNRANAHRGFTMALWLPQNAIGEQVIGLRYKRRGGGGGQPLSRPSSFPSFVFPIITKGILHTIKKTPCPEYFEEL